MENTASSNAVAASTNVGTFKVHVPFPQELGIECEKASQILAEFANSLSATSSSPVPPHAILQAKGIVVISSLKIGAGWSGRIGSGLVVAKLADGKWSAPSAVMLVGAGYGPQFGASMTDLVYVLTSDAALNSFLQTGQITLGAQLSLTTGESSKSMEASAVFSQGQAAPLSPGYCYAKSKGFFIGASFEGAVIATRSDANERFYNQPSISQAQLLSAALEPALATEPLYRALQETHRVALEKVNIEPSSSFQSTSIPTVTKTSMDVKPTLKQIKTPETLVTEPSGLYPSLPARGPDEQGFPRFEPIAIALYDYEAQRPTDLSFKKGDVIVVVSKSETQNDWWIGRLNGQEGRFPANRVKVEN